MKITFLNITDVTSSNLKNVVSNDRNRPSMTGVFIDLIDEKIVCTNAHILVTYPIQINFEEPQEKPFLKEDCKIVPLEYFDKSKYMGNWKNYLFPITYVLDRDFARVFNGEEEVFKCKYITENYPNYSNAFPEKGDKKAIEEICFNLSLIIKAEKAIPAGVSKNFKFVFQAHNRGVKLVSNLSDIEMIIMPITLF